MPADRKTVMHRLAGLISEVRRPHPVRVAIDGPDAAGKTTLSAELALLIEATGRAVIRASIDGFHRPQSERHARGSESREGYYLDSFDYSTLRALLLEPLGEGGNRRYRRAVFDSRADSPVDTPTEVAAPDAILLFDGVFLMRPELDDCWDCRIFLRVPFDETQRRAVIRDERLFGSAALVERRYAERYIPGQRLYLAAVQPESVADVVVVNTDPARPEIRVRRRSD